jgi:molybdopterin synthase sulfur carrier subunit
VYFFASLREALGCADTRLDWRDGTVRELVAVLAAREGQVWRQALLDDKVLVAVNQEIATLDARVAAGDEVAFFPPVTGG